MVYPISKLLVWPILALFIKRIDGIENLPKKPFILVANHESYIDGILLIMLVARYRNKQLCFFALNKPFTGPFWDFLFNHYGAIRINGSMEKGAKAMKKGKCIGIFPEGRRAFKKDGLKSVRHTGVGVLALLTNAPVVPVGLDTYTFWNKHTLIPTFKHNINITIGKPMKFKGKPTKANVKKVVNNVWNEVKELARVSHA